jgi:drug efflux transport system permease protein
MSLSLPRIRELLRKEVRQMFRDPRMKPLVFASPIIQLLLFGYAVNTDVLNTTTFVVDHDKSAESRAFVSQIGATGYFDVVGRSDRPEALVEALDHGTAVVGIEIPVGFSADQHTPTGTSVQVVVDGTNSNTGTIALGYVGRIIGDYSSSIAGARPPVVGVSMRAWYNPQLESRDYNVPAVLGILLLLMTLLLTSLAVVRERELGTLDQLMVSPLTPGELILGKTIPVAAVGVIDLALITTVAVLWFQIPLRGSLFALVPAALIYIVAGLSIGLLISSVSRTQQEAFMTMFLFLLPAIILSGFFYPISSMPVPFQWLTRLNPVRPFLEIVRGVFLKGTGYGELWPQFAILMTAALLGLWFATNRFKKSLG